MEDEFDCSICLEIAENAVETSCCHHLFCEKCLEKLQGRECPQCRLQFQVLVSHVARRIIGHMPVKCTFVECGMTITRSNVKEHERLCKYRDFICKSETCTFRGKKSEYVTHLFKQHQDDIAEYSHLCFSPQGAASSYVDEEEDRIAIKRNTSGRHARIGQTGKYYCQGELGTDCNCCDGSCGPGNGCNCKSCMKLDIASRRLPRGYLVNREGAICRKGKETGLFYCGRMVMSRVRQHDTYCGPDTGDNCQACGIIQHQHNSRYIALC